MKKIYLAISHLVFMFTGAACSTKNETAPKVAAPDQCDRACLEGFVDQYLDALINHDSSRLTLTENARYTENGQTLQMNDGMWQVASAIGCKKFCFADPQTGQVGFRGVAEEDGPTNRSQ